MTDDVPGLFGRAVAAWTGMVRRRAALVLLVALVACGATVQYLADNLAINTDTEDMLSPELPFRQYSEAISRAFPQFSDNILIVIDGQTPDIADDAARRLAARLRQEPTLFGSVYDPAGDAFFRRNGLLYLSVDELDDLYVKLAEAQPFLATLWSAPSMVSLFDMLSLALEHALDKDGAEVFDFQKVFEEIRAVAGAQAAGRFHHLSWQGVMGMNEDGGRTAGWRYLLIQPALDYASLQPAAVAIERIRALAGEMKLDARSGVRLRLTGSAALAEEELKSVEQGMGLAGALSVALVLIILVGGFRSLAPVVSILATLAMGLIWTAGFAIAAVGTLNLISVAFAVLFVGLSVDFGIHYVLRYGEQVRHGQDHAAALATAAGRIAPALAICALSTAIAFYSFLPTDYLGLAQLGAIAGTGMFIALAANLTLLPAFLTLLPKQDWSHLPAIDSAEAEGSRQRSFGRSVLAHRRAIAVAGLVLGLGAATQLANIQFDFDPMNLRDAETESVATLIDMAKDKQTSPYDITILAKDLDHARDLAGKLGTVDLVEEVQTLLDFVPSDQPEKLEIVGDLSLLLATSFTGPIDAPPPPPKVDDTARRKALARLAGWLGRYAAAKAGTPPSAVAAALDADLRRLFGAAAKADGAKMADMERRLLAELPGRIEALRLSLQAEGFGLGDLPDDVRSRYVAADGRARVVVTGREDVRDREALRRFVDAVRAVAPTAAEGPVTILEAGRVVLRAFLQAMVISVALVLVLLLAVFRDLRSALLVFAPVVLSALLTVAVSVLADLPFNFANVIVLPLLFGLSVDFGIHFIDRERAEDSVGGLLSTATPAAVLMSALTTVGSFGSIALSGHPGTASMGVLLTIAISLTLACTVFLLPALMAIFPPKDARPTRRE